MKLRVRKNKKMTSGINYKALLTKYGRANGKEPLKSNNAGTGTNNEAVEDNIPPVLKRPQEDIRAYAERSGLLKALKTDRPRDPTKKSVNPMPSFGTL